MANDTADWSNQGFYTSEQLADVVSMAAVAFIDLPVRKYSSIIVQGATASGFSDSVIEVEWHQAITPFGANDGYPYSDFLTNINTVNFTGTWALPVNASSVRIYNRGPAALAVAVWGTNRLLSKPRQLGPNIINRRFAVSSATTAGVSIPMASADGQLASTCFNGAITVFGFSSLVAGFFTMQYIQPNDVSASQAIFKSPVGGAGILVNMAHPLSVVQWSFLPDTTNAGVGSIQLLITQAGF